MATNRHASIRYQVLDRCFSNQYKEYYIDDLIEECSKELYYFDGVDKPISRRSIFNDINYMKSDSGWKAPIEAVYNGKKAYYRYSEPGFSINKASLSKDEVDELRETLLMFQRIKGMPNCEWMGDIINKMEDKLGLKGEQNSVLGYEQVENYTGFDYLTDLFNYIVNRQPVEISYQPFGKEEEKITIHPYYIKQYNNRWFLFGWNEGLGSISNLALDRILDIKTAAIEYKENTSIDFQKYFNDVVGVSVKAREPETIRLAASQDWLPFLETKPIHHSQIVKDRDAGIIEIRVIPNFELDALILSYGAKVKIVSPEWYKKKIIKKINDSLANYAG